MGINRYNCYKLEVQVLAPFLFLLRQVQYESMPKKIAVIFLLLFIGLLQPASISAQVKTPAINKKIQIYDKIPELKSTLESQYKTINDGDVNLGSHITGEKGVVSYTMAKIYFAAVGGDFTTNDQGKPAEKTGMIQSFGQYIAVMYDNPPATTEQYLAYVFDSAGIAQPAYAQGLGFASLNPILSIWTTFASIAYFFLIIIFVIIGFMIMFRQKISSQTIVTAQQAIPQIIVALITITFSYAIAGLLIDMMYLIMQLMVALFSPGNPSITSDLYTQNIFEVGRSLVGTGTSSVNDSVAEFIRATIGDSDIFTQGLAFIGGLTFAVVFAIALLIGIFRLFFELLKTYISIVISIAFAPIILMIGAIPGKNAFGGWVKSLIGNLATFPIVLLILIIFHIISSNVSNESSGFLAPYLIGQGSGPAIATLLSMGLILIATDIVKQGQKALGGGGGIFEQLGQNMGDAIKRGWTGDAELVPGLGFTNLRKSPLTSWAGGLSGQNVATKGASGIAGAGVGLFNAYKNMYREGGAARSATAGFGEGFRGGALSTASALGDETPRVKKWIEERKKQREANKEKGGARTQF